MQKLPEASDRKRGDARVKKRGHSDKRKNLILFQQWPAEWNTLLTGGGHHAFVFRRRIS